MKGWVYIISNPAMPGLIKIGHSTKDPELRAQELNNTGTPHSYLVEYEMLIEGPYHVEQQVHKALMHFREKKEWFRCSSEEAIAAIQCVADGRAINEAFTRVDREQAEKIRKSKEKAQVREKLLNEEVGKQELTIHPKYQNIIAERFPENPFWPYWVASSLGTLPPHCCLVAEDL